MGASPLSKSLAHVPTRVPRGRVLRGFALLRRAASRPVQAPPPPCAAQGSRAKKALRQPWSSITNHKASQEAHLFARRQGLPAFSRFACVFPRLTAVNPCGKAATAGKRRFASFQRSPCRPPALFPAALPPRSCGRKRCASWLAFNPACRPGLPHLLKKKPPYTNHDKIPPLLGARVAPTAIVQHSRAAPCAQLLPSPFGMSCPSPCGGCRRPFAPQAAAASFRPPGPSFYADGAARFAVAFCF